MIYIKDYTGEMTMQSTMLCPNRHDTVTLYSGYYTVYFGARVIVPGSGSMPRVSWVCCHRA